MTTLALISKCTCDEHECANQDDYTIEGEMCEQCFMDCVEMDEIYNV